MIHEPLAQRSRIILSVLGAALLLGAYLWLAELQHRRNPQNRMIPPLSGLAEGVSRMLASNPTEPPWLVADAQATLCRLAAGMALGIVVSVLLGLLMGCYAWLEALLLPPVSFLARIPPTAMIAVFFVLVGMKFQLFVSMIAFGLIPTMTQAIYLSARDDVPQELIHKAQTLGASQFEIVINVVLRQIFPRILDSIRLQVGPSMVYLLAAECMYADVGFGYRIRSQSRLSDMRVVYVYLALLGVAGFLADVVLVRLRRWWCPWAAR